MVGLNTGTVGRTGRTPMSCISKDLYDKSPHSGIFFIQWFYDVLHVALILTAKFRIGQFFISLFDSYMLKFEKTLDFCVPKHPTTEEIVEDHAQNLPENDRPMSWILFIPALIVLRIFRFWLSTCSILIFRGAVSPRDLQLSILHFRRYYRSVRHYAVDAFTKEDWQRRDERVKESMIWAILYKIYELIFMTKPLVEFHPDRVVPDSPETIPTIASTSRMVLRSPEVQSVLRQISRRSARRAAVGAPVVNGPTNGTTNGSIPIVQINGNSEVNESSSSNRASAASSAEEVVENGSNNDSRRSSRDDLNAVHDLTLEDDKSPNNSWRPNQVNSSSRIGLGTLYESWSENA